MTKLYYTMFNLVALSVVVYTGVDIFYRVACSQLRQVQTIKIVEQQPSEVKRHQPSPLDDFKAIGERNIFGSVEKASMDIKGEAIEELEPTSLRIALLGTVTGNEQNAFAVIEEADERKQGLYKVGDSVQDALVKMILRGKVVLRVGDKDEILTMEEAASSREDIASPSVGNGRPSPRAISRGSTITVDRKDLQRSLKDINQLLSQVRIRPHFKDGKADGLLITGMRRGSIFTKLGLRNGDIVQGIDGRSINSPDDILALYEQLNSGARMSLQITRRNEPKTINYRFR